MFPLLGHKDFVEKMCSKYHRFEKCDKILRFPDLWEGKKVNNIAALLENPIFRLWTGFLFAIIVMSILITGIKANFREISLLSGFKLRTGAKTGTELGEIHPTKTLLLGRQLQNAYPPAG